MHETPSKDIPKINHNGLMDEDMQELNQEMIALNEQVTTARDYAEAILINIREPMLVLDKNLRIKTANNAFYKTFRVNEPETEGVLVYDIGNKQWDIPALRTLLEKILPEKSVFNDFEVTHTFTSIGERVMLLNAREVINKNSSEKLILLSIEDITERKKAQEILDKSGEHFRQLVKELPAAVYSCDVQGRITFYNDAAVKVWGREPEIGKDLWCGSFKMYSPDGSPLPSENSPMAKAVKEGHAIQGAEIIIERPDGTRSNVQVFPQPEFGLSGEIIGAINMGFDITEQVSARNKLKESERHLRKTTEHFEIATTAAEVGTWSLDLASQTLEWSGLHKKMWGYDEQRTDLLYEDWHKVILADDKETAIAAVATALATNTPYEISYRIKLEGNGDIRWIRSSGKYLYNETGEAVALSGVSIDITKQKNAEIALKESEERFRLATETSGVGIWQWNVITNQIHWDAQMFHIYGVTPTADGFVQYTDWSNAVVPEELTEQERILQDTVKNIGSSNRSFKILRLSDGMPRYVEAVEIARATADGQAEWVIGTNMDVTERKEADQKLLESEKRFRNLVENAPSPICIFKGEDMILEVANEPVFKIWNVGKEALGKPFLEIKPEMKDQPFIEHLQDVLQNGVTHYGSEQPAYFIREDGEMVNFYFDFVYQPYFETDGTISGVMTLANDVTEQVKARNSSLERYEVHAKELEEKVQTRTKELSDANKELQLKNQQVEEAKEKLMSEYSRSLIEASLDPLITISAEGKITDMNEAFSTITGIARENLMDTDFGNYFTDPQKALNIYQEVFAKGYVTDYPLTIMDHKLTDVLFNGSVYKDEKGNVLGAVVVARDITDQKRIETELIEAKVFAEIAVTIAEEAKSKAESATHAAEDAVKSKQQFLSNMSHEIRTPMNAIIGFTKVLLKSNLPAKQKEYLSAIKMSGDALIVLINDILDLAKVDAGKMTFEQVPFKMALSITSMLHLFETKIQERNLALLTEYDSNIPNVLVGDPVRLHQIILNLVSNAVKFTTKGEIKVCVRLLDEDDEKVSVEFAVSDTGIGIPEEKIEKIFDNFHQASSSTARLFGGTGLGLAIVKQLVERQGGSIRVKSKVDEGSTFSFNLTFQKTKAEAEVTAEILKLDAENKNIKVLVVEDMALNQLLMKTLLDDFGFERDIADNGKIAIEKLETKSYDIILMDLQMPEMNGFEATEYIRNTLNSRIPIIALTADVTTVDVEKCKAVGMNDYIAKPVDERVLYSKIIGLVKKPALLKYQVGIQNENLEAKKLKCIDLEYLIRRTKSNPSLMMEMISLYLEQTPPLISAMRQSFDDKDWKMLHASVHKIIPSFLIMGIHSDFEKIARKVQEYASTQLQIEGIHDLVLQLENVCTQACTELAEEFNRIKKSNNG